MRRHLLAILGDALHLLPTLSGWTKVSEIER